MGNKIFLAAGCSFTDKRFSSIANDADEKYKRPYKMWPEYFSEHLELKCMNVGLSGLDNQSIYGKTLKAILTHGDRIDTVAVLWTGWDRFLFLHEYPISFMSFLEHEIMGKEKPQITDLDCFYSELNLTEVFMRALESKSLFKLSRHLRMVIQSNLFLMYTLAKICESKNIKYLFAQGIGLHGLMYHWHKLLENMEDKKVSEYLTNDLNRNFNFGKELLETPVFASLEKRKSNLIGWPFVGSLNGYSLDDHRYSSKGHFSDYPGNRFIISPNDTHPNEKGQEIISKYFIETYNRVYGKH